MRNIPLSILFAFLFLGTRTAEAQNNQRHSEHTERESNDSKFIADSIELFPIHISQPYQKDNFSSTPMYPKLDEKGLTMGMLNLGFENPFMTKKDRNTLDLFVKDYKFKNEKHLREIQNVSASHLDLISKIFEEHGIPTELKYLAVIESDLKNHARSYRGAVGPWQFMPTTARLLGLTVNANRDDRRDFRKSTIAAAKYLTQLQHIFKNWELTIAAYNSGPVKVKKAMEVTGSDDFWKLKDLLPSESRKHVLKFIATKYIMQGFSPFLGAGLSEAQLSKKVPDFPLQSSKDLAKVAISSEYSAAVIAKEINFDLRRLLELNPGLTEFLSEQQQTKSFELRLPPSKMITFKDLQGNILNQSLALRLKNRS